MTEPSVEAAFPTIMFVHALPLGIANKAKANVKMTLDKGKRFIFSGLFVACDLAVAGRLDVLVDNDLSDAADMDMP